jgi:uroporphyrinogen III methyltransferase/synthase
MNVRHSLTYDAMNQVVGKVYLVGAGPGDPGLLTLRGAECLRAADVVLYDYLASPKLLTHARPDAELVGLGRHGHGRLMSQEEINDAMSRFAREGRTVVRLKGGDPAIFAHLAEELSLLHSANISYEIVPGVTAAQAASSHAGIPLTQRDDASCVALVTGHERADEKPELDFDALAKFPGTLVFYMGVTTAPHWSRALIDHGKSPATPVAVVRRASLPDQETLLTTLGELTKQLQKRNLRPPAVIIVGEVAHQRDVANWFDSRSLSGRTILATRPEQQSEELEKQLRDLGANVICQPAIEIHDPADWSAVDAAIHQMSEFSWLVFSSANGVHSLLRRVKALGLDMRCFGSTKLAAIGPATAEALSEYSLRADMHPAEYRAEALAAELAPQVRGKRVLLARASRGREVLADLLRDAGAQVEQFVAYSSHDVTSPIDDVRVALADGKVDWVTVTSSAIARSLVHLFGDHLHKARIAAISPLTAEVLTELGYAPAAVADVYTTTGLVAAILAAESGKP